MQITVRELIEKLSKFPDNHNIVFWKNDNLESQEKEQKLTAISDKYFSDLDKNIYQTDEIYLELEDFI